MATCEEILDSPKNNAKEILRLKAKVEQLEATLRSLLSFPITLADEAQATIDTLKTGLVASEKLRKEQYTTMKYYRAKTYKLLSRLAEHETTHRGNAK